MKIHLFHPVFSIYNSGLRRVIMISLLLLLSCILSAQSRKKVAVVLSGGGAKGVAHIGALKVIEEAGIPIDYVIGTSMGAIVGGLYSIGYTPHQMDSMVKSQDWPYILSDRLKRSEKTFDEKIEEEKYVLSLNFKDLPKEVVPDGLIKGQNLRELFTTLTVGYHDSIDFNKLPVPFACVSVDLMEGKEVVFHEGILAEAMRASMAIPGVFTPVRLDSMVLVDGGLMNNFPTDVAQQMDADIIIGVDVQSGPKKDDNVETVADMVGKIIDMTSKAKYEENLKKTDLYIHVDVEGYSAASFNKEALDTLTRRGEEAARKEWDDMVALKSKIGIPSDFTPEPHGPYVFLSDSLELHIYSISFVGVENPDKVWLMNKCKLKENEKLTIKNIEHAISDLYGTQIYTNIKYKLNEKGDGYDLVFSLEDNRVNSFKLGLRFDTEEVATILLNAVYQFKTRIATNGMITARLGKRTGVRLDYRIYPNPLKSINFSYMYQYNDINIYSHGDREYNNTYHYNMTEIGYKHIFNQNLMLGFNLNYEHFNYKNFLFNDESKSMTIDPEGFFSYDLRLRYETMNKENFPTKGSSLQARGTLYTDNLVKYKGNAPFGAISLWWKTLFSPTERFSITPGIYGRVLIGNDIPYPYLNTMGGDTSGRYVPQQLPFVGIDFMGIFENSLALINLELRQQFGKKHYVFLRGNFALEEHDLRDLFDGRSIYGGGLGYAYDSFFGPLYAFFNLSNETKKLGFYLNLGYNF